MALSLRFPSRGFEIRGRRIGGGRLGEASPQQLVVLVEGGDVDNPAVPNMVNLGRVCCGGRRMRWGWDDVLIALGQPVDVSSLRKDYPPLLLEHWLIPAPKLLDVLVATPTPELEAVVSGLFPVLPDGRKVLQRTKTSSRDFVACYPATPGFIPD